MYKIIIILCLSSMALISCSIESVLRELILNGQGDSSASENYYQDTYVEDDGSLRIINLVNGDPLINKDMDNPLIKWYGGARVDNYYIVVKEENGRINWIARFDGKRRNTELIEKEFVSFNINTNKIIGTVNHTINLYGVSSDFISSDDKNEIQAALEGDVNVLESTSKRVYSGFKVWSDGIIGGIMDSSHVNDGNNDEDGAERPLIEWSLTNSNSNINKYIIWITKAGYKQPSVPSLASFFKLISFAISPPIWLGKTSTSNSNDASNFISGQGYKTPSRTSNDEKYYITVFAITNTSLIYFPNFLSSITDPSSVRASDLPNEVAAWSTIEFDIPIKAPFSTISPRDTLSDNHIGSDANAPFVSWKNAPTDTRSYYLVMRNVNTGELNWLVHLNGLDTNSITNTIVEYIPPRQNAFEQEYEISVYPVSNTFTILNDAEELHSSLMDAAEGVLGKATSNLIIHPMEPLRITNPISRNFATIQIGDNDLPYVSWVDLYSSSTYYLVMKNIRTDEVNWFTKLDGNDTDDVGESIVDYIPPEGTVLGENYKITVYSVSDNFISNTDDSALKASLESLSVGVLSSSSVELVVQKSISISSSSIEDGLLKSEHLGNRASPPLVEWSWGDNVDTSVVSNYYIAIIDEDFNPNAAIPIPTWYAKVAPEEHSSINASAVTIASIITLNYKPPSPGDDKEYTLLVIAAKSGFDPINLRNIDLSGVISGRDLFTELNNAGVLGVDAIRFRIPD